MAVSTPLELAVPEDVLAEVKRKSAEAEVESFQECIMDFFPDAIACEIYLMEDPDEDDRNWVVFRLTIPDSIVLHEVQRRKQEFYDALIQSRPHVAWPICSLLIRFA